MDSSAATSAIFGALAVAVAVPLSSFLLKKLLKDTEEKIKTHDAGLNLIAAAQHVHGTDIALLKQKMLEIEKDREADRDSRMSLASAVQQVLVELAVLKEHFTLRASAKPPVRPTPRKR